MSAATLTAFALSPLAQLDAAAAQEPYLQAFLKAHPSFADAARGWSSLQLDGAEWNQLYAAFGSAPAGGAAAPAAAFGIDLQPPGSRPEAMLRVARWLLGEAGPALKAYADKLTLSAGAEPRQALQQLLLLLESIFTAAQALESPPPLLAPIESVRARARQALAATPAALLGAAQPPGEQVLQLAVIAADAAEAVLLASEPQ